MSEEQNEARPSPLFLPRGGRTAGGGAAMGLPTPTDRPRRILVAGIGNIFFGDDGFGVEVAQRLLGRRYPPGVEVADFGIRGMDLAYTLLEDYDALVLVDTVSRGDAPGTLYLIEPELAGINPAQGAEAGRVALDAHSVDPVKVLAFARTLGARPIHTLLLGCEPTAPGGAEDDPAMHMGLSAPVQAAVVEAVKMLDALIEHLLTTNNENSTATLTKRS